MYEEKIKNYSNGQTNTLAIISPSPPHGVRDAHKYSPLLTHTYYYNTTVTTVIRKVTIL